MIQAKRLFRTPDFYRAVRAGVRSLPAGVRGTTRNEQFRERVMLAVTQVNGCEVCSQVHARAALEAGVSREEMTQLLTGTADGTIPEDQAPGVLFAQHYADSKGHPTEASWLRLQSEYGTRTARAILGWTRMIYIGNTMGIPVSLGKARRRGAPDPRSSVLYETLTPLANAMLIPLAVLHGLADQLRGRPLIAYGTPTPEHT